jgi:hypothetical protein
LRIRSSLGRGRSRRRLSGCPSSDWAALDLGVWLFRFENGCFCIFSYALGANLVLYHLEVALYRSQYSSPSFFCEKI